MIEFCPLNIIVADNMRINNTMFTPSPPSPRVARGKAVKGLSSHSKIDKTNGSLVKVESIAECSLGAFCNTFDMH